MRVIAGEFRSRVLAAPPGRNTRPTSDRLRETLFNVLGPRVVASRFADLFAGSGAVGIEALSRGAEHCLFVEHAPPAVTAVRKNLASLELAARALLVVRPVARALQDCARLRQVFDIVFLDPPYEAAEDYTATLSFLGSVGQGVLSPDAVVVAEHSRRNTLQGGYGGLCRKRVLEQGDAALSFYASERA